MTVLCCSYSSSRIESISTEMDNHRESDEPRSVDRSYVVQALTFCSGIQSMEYGQFRH